MIKLQNICKTYNKQKENQVKALNDISLQVSEGEMIAITGPSGSGKSTLLYILSFLENADTGEYYFEGKDVNDYSEKTKAAIRNQKISFVMQDYGLISSLTAYKNVEIPLLIAGIGRKEAKERAIQALQRVQLEEKINEKVGHLSGGQQQRVAIARAIVMNTKLLLADEPTGALDSETSLSIMNILEKLNTEGIAIIIATHDPIVASRCPRIIRLVDGHIVE